jgi:biopolymer transport protein TolR
VQLPEARTGQSGESRQLTIEMAADGTLSLNGELVTQERLEQQLQSTGLAEELRSVLIKADKRLPYGRVIEVMGLCQGAGFADIAVAVK